MIRNLREIILNRIAEIIRREDYEDLDVYGKRPALEELEVLNRLLMNVPETDLVNIPDDRDKVQNIKPAEGTPFKISSESDIINRYVARPDLSTVCTNCSNYIRAQRTGETLVCNCTLGLPSITCTYEYKGNRQ